MKKYLFQFILLLPLVVWAQTNQNKSGLSDYMWMSLGNAGFTPQEVIFTSLAFSPSGIPHVAYCDILFDHKAAVMKFDGSSWDYLGFPGFSTGGVSYLSLAFSPDGEPYVAFQDWTQSDKASVMKFSGTEWVYVGTPGFSADIASYTSLAINSNGEPFVAYGDKGNGWKATVKKFDGMNWVDVGYPGISAGGVLYSCLALDALGSPYVGFCDSENSQRASVMRFDGNQWVYVGSPGFSAGSISYPGFAISLSGQPYISYVDEGFNTLATVMMFNGNQWVNVGPGGFTPHGVSCTDLGFSPMGELYVALEEFIPKVLSYRAVVMKFDGTNWLNVGEPGFSVGRIDCPSLGFDPSGQLCLAYVDYGYIGKATVMTYGPVAVGVIESTKPGSCLYPNPASDRIFIDGAEQARISLSTIAGVCVRVNNNFTGPSFCLEGLPKGVYLLDVQRTDGSVTRKKIIIQ
jgi:hypothetical protein